MRSSIITFFSLFLFSWPSLFSQDEPIQLINPSFEGTPADGTLDGQLPTGWYDCGFPGETVPDVHPQLGGGSFQVEKPAFHGNTYMGLVVRENDTWEMISQRLSTPLQAGNCYEFSLSLCRSELYLSPSRTVTAEKVNYTIPAKLRIWGGSGYCNRAELLAESSLVVNTRWLEYNFRFEPKQRLTHIVFEAFYKTPTPFPYNGNILIDNASPILPVPCSVETPQVADVQEKPVVSKPSASNVKPAPVPPVKINDEANAKKPKILTELDRKKLKKGQTIRIEQLYFKADSSNITDASGPVLEEIYYFLAANPDVIVEIGGHTNSIPEDDYCDRLSSARAKAVADYLVHLGIQRDRLQYKGYGKRQPVETNKTAYGRQRNQRVEIKILHFNG